MQSFDVNNIVVDNWLIVAFAFFVLLFTLFRREKPKKGEFSPQGNLLTNAELCFYKTLQKSVADRFAVSFKVRLADIVSCHQAVWNAGGHKTSGKHIDFVLIDPKTTKIICGIELDDKSHSRKDRVERDSYVNSVMGSAGVPLLRMPVKRRYMVNEVKYLISHAIQGVKKS